MRISDWSSDVCSSDLAAARRGIAVPAVHVERQAGLRRALRHLDAAPDSIGLVRAEPIARFGRGEQAAHHDLLRTDLPARARLHRLREAAEQPFLLRSEEHTSELQSLMPISYAVFCLKQQTSHPSSTFSNALDTLQINSSSRT